jgi:hypothetical protein
MILKMCIYDTINVHLSILLMCIYDTLNVHFGRWSLVFGHVVVMYAVMCDWVRKPAFFRGFKL